MGECFASVVYFHGGDLLWLTLAIVLAPAIVIILLVWVFTRQRSESSTSIKDLGDKKVK